MSMITAIELSKDKHIQECLTLLFDPGSYQGIDVPQNAQSVLNAAKISISETSNCSSDHLKSEVNFALADG